MQSFARVLVLVTVSVGLSLAANSAYATDCAVGYYSVDGQEPCSACNPGTYQPVTGQTMCLQCAAGTYSGSGAAICDCCPAGTSSAIIGAASCNPCGAGTFQTSSCSTSCNDCPGGQATPCNNNGTCSDGPSGDGSCSCFAGYTGAACENPPPPCSPGSYSATGNEPCSPCSAGTYQSMPGQIGCSFCSAGTYSGSGAPSCDCCPAGSASPFLGASACGPCSSGTYELNTCSTACDPCPGGQATPCNNNGTCSDGPTGDGTCSCFAGYSGVACENGPPPSSTTTTLAAGCPPQPQTSGCLGAGIAGFQIGTKADPTKNQLKWKWGKGDQFAQNALGAPSSTTDYFLCVYDTTGNVASLATTIEVPYALFWTDKDPKGWSYKDKAGSEDGVQKVQLKTGGSGKSKAQLKAKGSTIPLPTPVGGGDYFDQDPSVTVQLRNSDGTCWTSSFTASQTKKNASDAFKASAK